MELHPKPATPEPEVPRRPSWVVPAILLACSALALAGAALQPEHRALWYFLPFTFLGNSLAPLPYDGAVIWLGANYPIVLTVVLGVIGTVLIEWWNMELLARLLARDGTRGFRRHPITQWTLRAYRRAPFWSLVATCILPIVPHYPMRVLAVLERYPMWKYQVTVVLGRGGRYLWLAALGWAVPIPGEWIVVASLIILALGWRGARKMNRYEEAAEAQRSGSMEAA